MWLQIQYLNSGVLLPPLSMIHEAAKSIPKSTLISCVKTVALSLMLKKKKADDSSSRRLPSSAVISSPGYSNKNSPLEKSFCATIPLPFVLKQLDNEVRRVFLFSVYCVATAVFFQKNTHLTLWLDNSSDSVPQVPYNSLAHCTVVKDLVVSTA